MRDMVAEAGVKSLANFCGILAHVCGPLEIAPRIIQQTPSSIARATSTPCLCKRCRAPRALMVGFGLDGVGNVAKMVCSSPLDGPQWWVSES
jgi:hypothetical protein